MQTPHEAQFYLPAEWQQHDAVWLAWPSREDLWQENLQRAQIEFIAFCGAIADIDPISRQARGEKLNILVPDKKNAGLAERALSGLPVRFHRIPFGDIWLRDTGPLFLKNQSGELAALRFVFNGWGEKYKLSYDNEVASSIIKASGVREFTSEAILEGGSIEIDGEGTCLTSRQCLLNPNRNRSLNQEAIEKLLQDHLGVTKILWLGDGLINDHTDGHIDTMARFSEPGVVLCMNAQKRDDPNFEILKTMQKDLAMMSDARGRKLEVRLIPSPGKIVDENREVMPASYLNFYISNTTVIVPTYGSPHDDEAVKTIGRCFNGRRTVGLSAKAILSGGGAFHCISQQQPTGGSRK